MMASEDDGKLAGMSSAEFYRRYEAIYKDRDVPVEERLDALLAALHTAADSTDVLLDLPDFLHLLADMEKIVDKEERGKSIKRSPVERLH